MPAPAKLKRVFLAYLAFSLLANIAFKLAQYLSDSAVVGPILLGLQKPVTVMMRGASAEDIFRMTAITLVDRAEA